MCLTESDAGRKIREAEKLHLCVTEVHLRGFESKVTYLLGMSSAIHVYREDASIMDFDVIGNGLAVNPYGLQRD